MQIIKNSNIDFINNSKLTILLSSALILAGIFSLIINNGPKLSIDFKGGTLIELRSTESKINVSSLRDNLNQLDLGDVSIKKFGNDKDYLVKFHM